MSWISCFDLQDKYYFKLNYIYIYRGYVFPKFFSRKCYFEKKIPFTIAYFLIINCHVMESIVPININCSRPINEYVNFS